MVRIASLGLLGAVIGLSTFTTVDSSRNAPGSACLQMDSSLVYYAQRLATDTDPKLDTVRQRYDISLVPLTEVERILDPSTCSDAARAYKSAIGLKGKAPDVEVVRIGSRYIVRSPAGKPEGIEFTSHVVLDLEFNEIAVFAG